MYARSSVLFDIPYSRQCQALSLALRTSVDIQITNRENVDIHILIIDTGMQTLTINLHCMDPN
jgi:hypothetical protein